MPITGKVVSLISSHGKVYFKTILYDKICLTGKVSTVHIRVSPINETDNHDISEILL